MPSMRTLSADLARHLAGVIAPVYVLSDRRQVVFANSATCRWLGVELSDLIGRTSSYHSSSAVESLDAKVAGLCPPPEVFAGTRLFAAVSCIGDDGQPARRRAEFIPLPDDVESWSSILAIVDLHDLASGETVQPSSPDVAEAELLHARLQDIHQQLRTHWQMDRLLGISPAITRARTQIQLAIGNSASVLVVGPPGSGRQHVARAIHYGVAASLPGGLFPLSCFTLGGEMLSAALAALQSSQDATVSRSGATLLLGDVQDLPKEAQAEFARRLIGDSWPFKIVSTAQAPLDTAVPRGEFRADLAAALSTIVIHLPPLAQRREDIPLLAQMFLEEMNAREEKQLGGFSPEALDRLAAYSWPGNIDELGELVREAHAIAEGAYVASSDLPKRIYLSAAAQRQPRKTIEPIELDRVLAKIEVELIQRAMRMARGNKTKAAKLLSLTRPRLYRRMVQLGLEKPE